MPKFIIAVLLAVGVAFPAAGADFKKGSDAYWAKDYATALQEWRPLAEQGNTKAQSSLARMYFSGTGVPQDYAEAYIWYSLAVADGKMGVIKLRNSTAKKLSPEQLAEAQREAAVRREAIQKRTQ